jgi:hypothetical protein
METLCPLRPERGDNPPNRSLRLVLELDPGESPSHNDIIEERMDQPYGAAFSTRRFHSRRTITRFIPTPVLQEA